MTFNLTKPSWTSSLINSLNAKMAGGTPIQPSREEFEYLDAKDYLEVCFQSKAFIQDADERYTAKRDAFANTLPAADPVKARLWACILNADDEMLAQAKLFFFGSDCDEAGQ